MPAIPTYSVGTISKLFNLTDRRVQQLAKDEIIPKPDRGKYELIGCVQGYIKYLQDRAFGKNIAPIDSHAERTRLLKAQADDAELELGVKRGTVFIAAEIEKPIDRLIEDSRRKLLAIPTKAAPHVIGCQTIVEAEGILKIYVHESLNELSTTDPIAYMAHSAPESLDTTTGSDGEPVGGHVSETQP